MSYYYNCHNDRDQNKEQECNCKNKNEQQLCCNKVVEETICCYPQPWDRKEEYKKDGNKKDKNCGCHKIDDDCERDYYKHGRDEEKCNKMLEKKDNYNYDKKEDNCREKDKDCGYNRHRCNCCICNFFKNFRF